MNHVENIANQLKPQDHKVLKSEISRLMKFLEGQSTSISLSLVLAELSSKAKNKLADHIKFLSEELKSPQEDLREILNCLKLKDRRVVSGSIKAIQDAIGDDTDYLFDGRGKHWASKKPEPLKVRVVWRSAESEAIISIPEAAKEVGISAHALKIRLSKGDGAAHFTIQDGNGVDVVSIFRI